MRCLLDRAMTERNDICEPTEIDPEIDTSFQTGDIRRQQPTNYWPELCCMVRKGIQNHIHCEDRDMERKEARKGKGSHLENVGKLCRNVHPIDDCQKR